MQPKWSVRPYRDGDEERIFELMKIVWLGHDYDRDRWLRGWHWMYRENPAGRGRIWVAEDKDRIVGHSAFVPVVIKIGSESVVACQGIDAMTHPDYRHQGIWGTLARITYTEAAKEGIQTGYIFPNENSHAAMVRKLGWLDVSQASTILKPLNWGNTLKLKTSNKLLLKLGSIGGNVLQETLYKAKKVPALEGLTISQITCFDERINEFWAKVSNQYQIMVVRNKDYLNWRYVNIPDTLYSIFVAEKAGDICGYTILQRIQLKLVWAGVIFDTLAQSPEIAQCLLSQAVAQCKKENVDLIYCSMIADKALFHAFKKNGFMRRPFKKAWWFCAYSSTPDISKEFLKKPQNWFVQRGDSALARD